MAFSTIQGSGGAPDSFVGTSGVDSITLIDNAGNFFLGAQEADDFIGFTSTFLDSGLTSNGTLKGGQGTDTFSNLGNVTFVASFFNGNGGGDIFGANAASVELITSTLQGGQGADSIFIDNTANSFVNGNKDGDTITLGTDTGTVSASSIHGGQGNDTINTTAGGTTAASLISADDGNDQVTLAAADFTTSTASGGAGNDTINAGALAAGSNAVIDGGDGIDDLTGGAGNDTILGGAGIDAITTGAGNNSVDAGNDDDAVTGGAGNDTITGGAGADQLTSGAGTDVLRYAAGVDGSAQTGAVATGAIDRITDFTTGTDVISGFGVAGSAAEFTSVAGAAGSTYATALAAANAAFAATPTQSYFMTSFGAAAAVAQGVLFLNMDNNAVADGAILIGQADGANFAAAAARVALTDILA